MEFLGEKIQVMAVEQGPVANTQRWSVESWGPEQSESLRASQEHVLFSP